MPLTCPPTVYSDVYSPLNWTMIGLEVAQFLFQLLMINYLSLYLKTDSINFLCLAFSQLALFFITSLLTLLFFFTNNGTRHLNCFLTIANYFKLLVDTFSYASVVLSNHLVIFDTLQVYYLVQIFRFLTICVYSHVGARCDFYTNKKEEEQDVVLVRRKVKKYLPNRKLLLVANETGKPLPKMSRVKRRKRKFY